MHEKENCRNFIKQIDFLLNAGRSFLRIPDGLVKFTTPTSSSELSVPVSLQKEEWIESSVNILFNNLPKAIIEEHYPDILSIHNSKKEDGHIIKTNDINKQINIIGAALFEFRQFGQWLLSFDDNCLSNEQRVNITYMPLKIMQFYFQRNIFTLLVGKEDGRTSKTAILHLYGRMFALMQSVVNLNRIFDCYLLTASLRMLLELYVDMLLIKENHIENDIEKFFSHHELFKFRTAKNISRIDTEIKKNE